MTFRIAIDLNDVVRDYSSNFLKYYLEGYNRNFDLTDFEFWSHNMNEVFQFQSDSSYFNFIYNDYAFELYGKCGTCGRGLQAALKKWMDVTLHELDAPYDVEVILVSTKEYGLSIGNTYYFISKLGLPVREVYFPEDSKTIWDKCNALITANPDLLDSKPLNKVSVKIEMPYNEQSESDYKFNNLESFLSDPKNTMSLNYAKN